MGDYPILDLLVGQPTPLGPRGELSAIGKQPVTGPVELTRTGLSGDAQGDTRNHGGLEKAAHQYPREHYAAWAREFPHTAPLLTAPGAFGENFSVLGMTEETVCVGDIYQAGSVLLQVSQVRQPCWKLNARFGEPAMAKTVQHTGRTGWYYRVLEPGRIQAGDVLSLVERPHPDWTLARLLRVLYRDVMDIDALRQIADLELLAAGMRRLAQRRLDSRQVEDWQGRLNPPKR